MTNIQETAAAADPASEAEKRLAERSAKRREMEARSPEEVAKTGKADEPTVVPVSREKMLNLPERTGLAGLHLFLKALPSKFVGDLVNSFFTWPSVLYISSKLPTLPDGTLDIEGIAAYYNQLNASTTEEVVSDITPSEVSALLMQAELEMPHHVRGIADTVWMVASTTPGVAWPKPPKAKDDEPAPEPPAGCEWLDDLLLRSLTIPDYCRLPMLVLRANSIGGGWVDDLCERFGLS